MVTGCVAKVSFGGGERASKDRSNHLPVAFVRQEIDLWGGREGGVRGWEELSVGVLVPGTSAERWKVDRGALRVGKSPAEAQLPRSCDVDAR